MASTCRIVYSHAIATPVCLAGTHCQDPVCRRAHGNLAGSTVNTPIFCVRGSMIDCDMTSCPFNHLKTVGAFEWFRKRKVTPVVEPTPVVISTPVVKPVQPPATPYRSKRRRGRHPKDPDEIDRRAGIPVVYGPDPEGGVCRVFNLDAAPGVMVSALIPADKR